MYNFYYMEDSIFFIQLPPEAGGLHMLRGGKAMNYIQIAIDGPAGAGKSTIAKKLAKRLNYIYIDTGAMYRAITYKAIKNHINIQHAEEVIELAKNTQIMFSGDNIYLDDEIVNEEVRSPEVSKYVSYVAQIPEVRRILVEIQRNIANCNNVVMDGRDIGSHVLVNANMKIFLTASVEERARRRYSELLQKGLNVSLSDIQREIIERDKMDSERKCSPLIKANDAVVIDTTGLTIEEVVEKVEELLREKGI